MKQSKSNSNKKNIIIIDNYFLEIQHIQELINKYLAILLASIMCGNSILLTVLNFFKKYDVYTNSSNKIAIYKRGNNSIPKLTYDMIKDRVNHNENLQNKQIILNEDLINYSLNYINKEENDWWRGILYNSILPKFDVVEKNFTNSVIGTWSLVKNKISIDYERTTNYSDTFNHEFLHLMSPYNDYSFINEAYTEILSNEFQVNIKKCCINDIDTCTLDLNFDYVYKDEQYYTKILMDIIGSEPLSEYYFSGDINYVIKELKPYLDNDSINSLLNSFKYKKLHIEEGLISHEFWNDNLNNIENILSKLYYEKYHQNLDEVYFDKIDFKYDYLGGIPFTGYFNKKINEYIDKWKIEKSKCINDKALNSSTRYMKSLYGNGIDVDKQTLDYFNSIIDWFDNLCILDVCLENQILTKEEKKLLFNSNYINDFDYYHHLYKNYYDNVYNLQALIFYLSNLKIYILYDENSCMVSDYSDNIGINKKFCYYYAKANDLSYGDVYNKFLVEYFVNSLSFSKEYMILNNGCNKIILKEYYGIELEKESEYSKVEEKITKILMDLLGSDYVKIYIITGNTDLIKQKLMDTLNEEDANLLLNCLSKPLSTETNNYDDIIDTLNGLFNKLQYNLYGIYGSYNYISDYKINYNYYFNTKYLNELENDDIFFNKDSKNFLLKFNNN